MINRVVFENELSSHWESTNVAAAKRGRLVAGERSATSSGNGGMVGSSFA